MEVQEKTGKKLREETKGKEGNEKGSGVGRARKESVKEGRQRKGREWRRPEEMHFATFLFHK